MCPRPTPHSSLLGAGHLREGRGIATPSPLRPLPASFPGVPRLPPIRRPQSRRPRRPQSRGPPHGGSSRGALTVKVRLEPRPSGPRPLGLPGSSVRGWHHRTRRHRRAPGIPTPPREQRRLRRDAGERAGGGSGGVGCPLIPGAGKRWASNLRLILRGSDHAAGCAAILGPAAMTGAVVAALGLRNRATASVGG